MSQTVQSNQHKGVICLFCGLSTFLSFAAENRHFARPDECGASIVRCRRCGKEALYLRDEIVDLQVA